VSILLACVYFNKALYLGVAAIDAWYLQFRIQPSNMSNTRTTPSPIVYVFSFIFSAPPPTTWSLSRLCSLSHPNGMSSQFDWTSSLPITRVKQKRAWSDFEWMTPAWKIPVRVCRQTIYMLLCIFFTSSEYDILKTYFQNIYKISFFDILYISSLLAKNNFSRYLFSIFFRHWDIENMILIGHLQNVVLLRGFGWTRFLKRTQVAAWKITS